MTIDKAIEIICAWCGRHLGTKDGQGQTGTTHTICPRCRKKLRKGGAA